MSIQYFQYFICHDLNRFAIIIGRRSSMFKGLSLSGIGEILDCLQIPGKIDRGMLSLMILVSGPARKSATSFVQLVEMSGQDRHYVVLNISTCKVTLSKQLSVGT